MRAVRRQSRASPADRGRRSLRCLWLRPPGPPADPTKKYMLAAMTSSVYEAGVEDRRAAGLASSLGGGGGGQGDVFCPGWYRRC